MITNCLGIPQVKTINRALKLQLNKRELRYYGHFDTLMTVICSDIFLKREGYSDEFQLGLKLTLTVTLHFMQPGNVSQINCMFTQKRGNG